MALKLVRKVENFHVVTMKKGPSIWVPKIDVSGF
jgi:hypothetical protein